MNSDKEADRNEDPITGEPGAHPVGVGIGTAGGAATGAAVGAVGGPVGAVVGAVVGGVVGAYAGKGVAEKIDPTVEAAYWNENHNSQDWASKETTYDDYEPAYRMGYEGRRAGGNAKYEDKEGEFERSWDSVKGNSRLKWEQAKLATRASWHRIEDRLPGDADHDGH